MSSVVSGRLLRVDVVATNRPSVDKPRPSPAVKKRQLTGSKTPCVSDRRPMQAVGI